MSGRGGTHPGIGKVGQHRDPNYTCDHHHYRLSWQQQNGSLRLTTVTQKRKKGGLVCLCAVADAAIASAVGVDAFGDADAAFNPFTTANKNIAKF